MSSGKARSPSYTGLPQVVLPADGRESTPNWPELLELPENLGELVAAFNLHIAAARRLPREEHQQLLQDAAQVLLNVAYNAEKLRHSAPTLSDAENERVDAYLSLARALLAAARRCRSPMSGRELAALMQRVDELQRCALTAAHACAYLGLIPAHEIRAISKHPESLGQCPETLALYRRHPDILDKTPMTPALLEELEQRYQLLSQALVDDCDQNKEHAQDRNALWTLLVRQHDLIWQLGSARWGARIDAKLRSLHFRPLRAA